MAKSKTVTESQADFGQRIVCAQQVFAHFADRLGIAPDVAMRTASCFGSGLGRADVCGCVTGALMVLGLAHGHGGACSRAEQRALIVEKGLFASVCAPLVCAACDMLEGLL